MKSKENGDQNGARLLVVDDDLVSCEYLTSILANSGFSVATADGVPNAQSILTSKGPANFECVVTDYLMPEQSGLDLLAWIKQHDPSLATILLTGQGQSSVIAESLRGGAVDFLDKPVKPAQLREAIHKAIARTRQERQLAQMATAVKDLGRAQRWMLHSNPVGEAASVDLHFHPKLQAGGDFFSHLRLSQDQYCFLLTDVSGHDLQAAFISAYFQGIVRGMLERQAPVWEVFRFFNQFLLGEWKEEKALRPQAGEPDISLAATAALVDFKARVVTTLTTGMPAPVYMTPKGYARRLGESGGYPLGWFPDISISALTYGIDDGGSILMWTDGLEDLANAEGVSPLALAFRWQRAKLAGVRLPLLDTSDDDVLLSRIDLGKDNASDNFHPLVLDEYTAAQAGEIDDLMGRWRRSLRLAIPELPATVEHDLCLAGREAVLNALRHGCREHPEYPATFQIGYRKGLLRLWVQDPGQGHEQFLEQDWPENGKTDPHFGLTLIKCLPQAVKFDQEGARVTMDFSLT